MNISTYESRIAALEAQLGPGPGPGPGPTEIGLLRVESTPNPYDTSGTQLNEAITNALPLLEVHPMSSFVPDDLTVFFQDEVTAQASYSITVYPKPGCYAVFDGDGYTVVSDEPGASVTGHITINFELGSVNFLIGAFDGNSPESSQYGCGLNVIFEIGSEGD